MERKGSRTRLISYLVCLCLMASIAAAESAGAWDQADLDKIWSGPALKGADLSGANLTGADLRNADMEKIRTDNRTNLSGANLTGADLHNADLDHVDLTGADLTGAALDSADLTGANLSGANLTGADLFFAILTGADLTRANLSGADLSIAYLSGTIWTNGSILPDGTVCRKGSIGRCITQAPTPATEPSTSCTKPTSCPLKKGIRARKKVILPVILASTVVSDAEPAVSYYVVYEGENLLAVIDGSALDTTVPEGLLRYGRTYEYYFVSFSAADELVDYIGPVTFTVGPKPDKEDDYGNPLAGQALEDAEGKTISLADKKLATLIAAGSGVLSQAAALSALQASGGVVTGPNGTTITMNTDDVHVARTNGGTDAPFVMAASATHTIGFIKPLTASGYTVDGDGKMKTSPDVTVSSNVYLPFGLFDFNVLLGDYTNRVEVVIVPPAPFGAGTKWYKVASDGTVKEYPNFVVDALGNGILTLYDNDKWDANPAWGIVRDPGGPGVASAATSGGSGNGGSGCFIATAAYGSYLHPYVKVLRMFRDTILLSSSLGSSFVRWYYRVSPPVADVIAKNGVAKAGVRVMLFPAIGVAWLWLNAGMVPTMLMLLVLGAILFAATRLAWRRI